VQYVKFNAGEREELLRSLSAMPDYLYEQFDSLTAEDARLPGPGGAFSPVEQVWHLADLEREGFGVRIRRLRDEQAPRLPDFDGAGIARERHYRSLSLREGLAAFALARKANLATLQSLPGEAWARRGTQEGVGVVTLCDLPALLLQHDQAHRLEIEEWKQQQAEVQVRSHESASPR
jgi:hypothetical protein